MWWLVPAQGGSWGRRSGGEKKVGSQKHACPLCCLGSPENDRTASGFKQPLFKKSQICVSNLDFCISLLEML